MDKRAIFFSIFAVPAFCVSCGAKNQRSNTKEVNKEETSYLELAADRIVIAASQDAWLKLKKPK